MAQTLAISRAVATYLLDEDGKDAEEFARRVQERPEEMRGHAIRIIQSNFLSHEPFVTTFITKTGITIPPDDKDRLASNVLDALLHICHRRETKTFG